MDIPSQTVLDELKTTLQDKFADNTSAIQDALLKLDALQQTIQGGVDAVSYASQNLPSGDAISNLTASVDDDAKDAKDVNDFLQTITQGTLSNISTEDFTNTPTGKAKDDTQQTIMSNTYTDEESQTIVTNINRIFSAIRFETSDNMKPELKQSFLDVRKIIEPNKKGKIPTKNKTIMKYLNSDLYRTAYNLALQTVQPDASTTMLTQQQQQQQQQDPPDPPDADDKVKTIFNTPTKSGNGYGGRRRRRRA